MARLSRATVIPGNTIIIGKRTDVLTSKSIHLKSKMGQEGVQESRRWQEVKMIWIPNAGKQNNRQLAIGKEKQIIEDLTLLPGHSTSNIQHFLSVSEY